MKLTTPALAVTCAAALTVASAVLPAQSPGVYAANAPPALQSLPLIEKAVRDELARQAPGSTAEVAPLDARLRFVACDRPLRASVPPNISLGARVNVRVTCTGGAVNWALTVPAELWSEVPLVVTQRALVMGSVVGVDDISVEVRRFPGTAQCCAADPAEVLGRVVRRSLPAQQAIALDALEIPPAVKRGETVMVIASLPGLEIRASGVALGDALAGQSVRVRHSTSLKVIQARADTPGVVRVDR